MVEDVVEEGADHSGLEVEDEVEAGRSSSNSQGERGGYRRQLVQMYNV